MVEDKECCQNCKFYTRMQTNHGEDMCCGRFVINVRTGSLLTVDANWLPCVSDHLIHPIPTPDHSCKEFKPHPTGPFTTATSVPAAISYTYPDGISSLVFAFDVTKCRGMSMDELARLCEWLNRRLYRFDEGKD
jgi:hypothetical protein